MIKHACDLLAAAVVATGLHAVPARADHMPEAVAAVVDVVVVLPGLVLSVPNIVHVAEGRRPAVAWPVTGLVLGAVGAGLSALALSDVRAQSHDNPSLAIAGLAGSAIEIAFALWAWVQPTSYAALAPASSRLTVAPLLVRDAGARLTCGVAIKGVGF